MKEYGILVDAELSGLRLRAGEKLVEQYRHGRYYWSTVAMTANGEVETGRTDAYLSHEQRNKNMDGLRLSGVITPLATSSANQRDFDEQWEWMAHS